MILNNVSIPILGFAAFSGVGKTTLLIKILAALRRSGYRIGVVKHAHHSFEIDLPGKDSYELRKAGAIQTLIGSRHRWALVVETERQLEPRLDDLLQYLDQDSLDFILVEGFKAERFPKIELHRPKLGHPLLHPDDDSIIAIASDAPLPVKTSLPLLDLNQPDEIAGFVMEFLGGSKKTRSHASDNH